MLKKLTDEKRAEILEAGIAAFAAHGPDRASMRDIARQAGISVGVLYKYYADKDAFFLACLRRSLDVLESVISEVLSGQYKLLGYAEQLLRAVQRYAREHEAYIRMYQAITVSGYAGAMADEIEGVTARIYPKFLEHAQRRGDIRADADPRLFAFFFDNLLMMMQFSYCSDYYRRRFQLYCGADILSDDDRVVRELLKFLESAFTLEQGQIQHRPEESS